MASDMVIQGDREICRARFPQIIVPGLGPFRKVEIKDGKCTIQSVDQHELNKWKREHGGFGRSYAYDLENWSHMDLLKFSRLTMKYQSTFFVVLLDEDVKILPTRNDAF